MPDIARAPKDEVARLARRETKRVVGPGARSSLRLRRTTAELRRRVAHLEHEVRVVRKTLKRLEGEKRPSTPEATGKVRITAKSVRSLRRRFRLSSQAFARLLGVSGQLVYAWERAARSLRVRQTTRAAILAARTIGAREARRRVKERGVATGGCPALPCRCSALQRCVGGRQLLTYGSSVSAGRV